MSKQILHNKLIDRPTEELVTLSLGEFIVLLLAENSKDLKEPVKIDEAFMSKLGASLDQISRDAIDKGIVTQKTKVN
jgi:hypothetical protein